MNLNEIILLLFLMIQIKLFSTQIENEYVYSKLNDKNCFTIADSTFLLTSFESNSKHKCLASCTKSFECTYAVFQRQKCFICKRNLTLFMRYDPNETSLIYQKNFKQTNGLINYWAFNKNVVKDSVGNKDLVNGFNAALTIDRFGIPDSALSLTNGYYQVPAGVYFSGDQFSFMAWVKIRTIQQYSRLIDFGFLGGGNVVMLSLSDSTSGKPYLYFQSGGLDIVGFSTKALDIGKWQHLACVYSFPFYSIYIDGVETTAPGSRTNLASFILTNIERTSNFIGRSNWYNNPLGKDLDANSDFDDLKIFNRALSPKEIQFEMNNSL